MIDTAEGKPPIGRTYIMSISSHGMFIPNSTSIVLYVLPRFAGSDYPFGIFKLFLKYLL